ncbi:MAG: thioredoxin family protein [Oligosphaeraceae bacterium]|nr:thioredoxin family protein [Oligosphaeraceae bacterium]
MFNSLSMSLLLFLVLLFQACDSKPAAEGAAPSASPDNNLQQFEESVSANVHIDHDTAKVGVWTTNYDAALKLAEQEQLPIILNFTGSDWCRYCKILMRDVFSQQEWQDWVADKFILVYLDFPRNPELINAELMAQNAKLREQFQVEAFPSLLVLEHDGNLLGQVVMREDNSVRTVQRNLRAINRRRKTVVQQIIAAMPEAQRQETQAMYDKIQQDSKLLSDMIKEHEENMQKLQLNIIEMSEKTEKAIVDSIVVRLSPEKQAEYQNAKQEMQTLSEQLSQWLERKPEQSEQNILLYRNFQKQLQEQSDKISDIIDGVD